MKDVCSQIKNLIETVADNVFYQFPDTFENLPCVSYFESNHNAVDWADNKSNTDEIEYTIDCWEKVDQDGNFNEIHYAVDSILIQNGYLRAGFVNQYEEDTRITHITMKYKINIPED